MHLVRTTSDEFFNRRHPFAHLAGQPVDLAFIDGMHLSEFALRDFINTEKFCHAGSVVVFDDMLPRNVIEAGRGREGRRSTAPGPGTSTRSSTRSAPFARTSPSWRWTPSRPAPWS